MPILDDNDDLPEGESAPVTPRDPSTGQFVAPTQQQVTPVPTAPAAPSRTLLALAKRFGIADAGSMSADELDRLIYHLTQQQQPTAVPAQQPALAEDAIDWGKHDDGTPMTEADYTPLMARTIKATQKLEKDNAALRDRLERRDREDAEAKAVRSLDQELAKWPQLFGERPSRAPKDSVERERYDLIYSRLVHFQATGQATTLAEDVARAARVFGAETPAAPAEPAPTPKPDPAAAYRNGELARPTHRRGSPTTDRREIMLAEELARRGESLGSMASYSNANDNDDLPD